MDAFFIKSERLPNLFVIKNGKNILSSFVEWFHTNITVVIFFILHVTEVTSNSVLSRESKNLIKRSKSSISSNIFRLQLCTVTKQLQNVNSSRRITDDMTFQSRLTSVKPEKRYLNNSSKSGFGFVAKPIFFWVRNRNLRQIQLELPSQI